MTAPAARPAKIARKTVDRQWRRMIERAQSSAADVTCRSSPAEASAARVEVRAAWCGQHHGLLRWAGGRAGGGDRDRRRAPGRRARRLRRRAMAAEQPPRALAADD